MNPPLTADEKRVLLQLLYLENEARNQVLADVVPLEGASEQATFQIVIPDDYDSLLAAGPFSLWNLASGGAYDFAAELLDHWSNALDDLNLQVSMAVSAACRDDVAAAQHWIDLALVSYRNMMPPNDVEPHMFGWTDSLNTRCRLALACQMIGDQKRLLLIRKSMGQFLQNVDAYIQQNGQTPLPDCAHELRMLLDLKWYKEVRFVLRHLPGIYCFIGSYAVNLRLMNALLEHNMSEHIGTMIGASTDATARNGFRKAAIAAAITHGQIWLAWDMILGMESEKHNEKHGALGLFAEHAAQIGQLHHWKTIMDWNDRMQHKPLEDVSQFHFMLAVSMYGNHDTRKEVWERACRWQPPTWVEDEQALRSSLVVPNLLIAALAGEVAIVEDVLENVGPELDVRALKTLRNAAVQHDMEAVIEWAQARLRGEGNKRIFAALELELERQRANKPNQFKEYLNYYKELVFAEPIKYQAFANELETFIWRNLRDMREMSEFVIHFPDSWLRLIGSPATSAGDLQGLLTEARHMDAYNRDEFLMYGLQKCLINRYGIQEKMDRFDSGWGI